VNASADPRLWHFGWLVTRRLAQAIRALLGHPAMVLGSTRVLGFGYGARLYEAWFRAAGAQYRGADLDGQHEVRIGDDGALAAAARRAPPASLDGVPFRPGYASDEVVRFLTNRAVKPLEDLYNATGDAVALQALHERVDRLKPPGR
jgi:hypothetical protein